MIEKIVAFDKTKPARLLAMKVVFTRMDSVHSEVNIMKASEKIKFSCMNARAGDQRPIPMTKMLAVTIPVNPLKVRQELMNLPGLSA